MYSRVWGMNWILKIKTFSQKKTRILYIEAESAKLYRCCVVLGLIPGQQNWIKCWKIIPEMAIGNSTSGIQFLH